MTTLFIVGYMIIATVIAQPPLHASLCFEIALADPHSSTALMAPLTAHVVAHIFTLHWRLRSCTAS